jgi:hypothetical protein
MCERDSSNTHEVIRTLFLAMNTAAEDRAAANIPRWALGFPYVNGGLFSGNLEVPRFSKIARSYLLHIGNLDWKKINPDIFGSMIQAVAEDADDDDRRHPRPFSLELFRHLTRHLLLNRALLFGDRLLLLAHGLFPSSYLLIFRGELLLEL